MPAYIKTLDEIYNDLLNAHADEHNINVADIGDSFRVTYKVFAGEMYPAYLAISKSQNNLYPDISEKSELIRDGYNEMGRYPMVAVSGVYNVQVNGTIGATIDENTRFQSSDTSTSPEYLFILDSEVTLVAGTDIIQLRALTPGLESKLEAGDTLSSMQPLTNISNTVTVESISVEAQDEEDIEDYREDLLLFKRLEPNGGSGSDYALWTSANSAIRSVYVLAGSTPVDIICGVEVTESNTVVGQKIGTPSQTVLDSLYKNDDGTETGLFIQDPDTLRYRKPVGVQNIDVKSINHYPVDVYLTDLSDLNQVSIVQSALEAYLYNKRPYVASSSVLLEKNDTITIGEVINAVYSSFNGTGAKVTTVELRVNGVAVNEFQFTSINIPYLRQLYNNLVPV